MLKKAKQLTHQALKHLPLIAASLSFLSGVLDALTDQPAKPKLLPPPKRKRK